MDNTTRSSLRLNSELEDAPDTPDIVEITFDAGIPISLNGENMSLANLILTLNEIAGKHGVGIILLYRKSFSWH